MTDKDKQDFVADVIKEYLHLSASSVKIKYPLVINISNETLIEQTRHLPFYQYHDFMIRIMEKEIKRMEEVKKKKQEGEPKKSQADFVVPKMTNRRSLGNFFGLFGGKEGENKENYENEFKKAKELNSSSVMNEQTKKMSSNNVLSQQTTTQDTTNKLNLETQPDVPKLFSEKKRNSAPMGKKNVIPQDSNIEQLLDDMDLDLDGILDEAELRRTSSMTKTPSVGRNRSRSGDNQAGNVNNANSEDTQGRRAARSALSRAMSRR